jgi:hypothetical protein
MYLRLMILSCCKYTYCVLLTACLGFDRMCLELCSTLSSLTLHDKAHAVGGALAVTPCGRFAVSPRCAAAVAAGVLPLHVLWSEYTSASTQPLLCASHTVLLSSLLAQPLHVCNQCYDAFMVSYMLCHHVCLCVGTDLLLLQDAEA